MKSQNELVKKSERLGEMLQVIRAVFSTFCANKESFVKVYQSSGISVRNWRNTRNLASLIGAVFNE